MQFFSGDYGGAATTLGRLVEPTLGKEAARATVGGVESGHALPATLLDQHGQAAALIFRLPRTAACRCSPMRICSSYSQGPTRIGAAHWPNVEAPQKKAEAEKHAATARATFEKLYTANLQVGAFKRRAGGAPRGCERPAARCRYWRLSRTSAPCGSRSVRAYLKEEGARRTRMGPDALVPISES